MYSYVLTFIIFYSIDNNYQLIHLFYNLDFASYTDDTIPYICGQDFITSSSSEELLGVLIDSELTFCDHITRLFPKAGDDDDELFLWYGCPTMIIVRNSRHRESPSRWKQDLNLE